jgi:caspase domain-containing protein
MIKRLFPMAAMIGGAILSMVLAPDVAWADKRVALIVGNSTYQTVPRLPNPSRDATAVAKMFKDAGFDSVDIQLDVGNLEFKRSIRRFEALADQADIAVVYYAGHGLEIGGTNYLIPVDAKLASDRDAEDETIPLERLVSSADGAKRLRLVILDACRDNPYISTMRRERKVATRAVTAGLGRVEPTNTDTLIAYAAKAGSTADDGDGEHSPFTTSLLKNLTIPGLDVRLAFGRVRDEVLKSTGNRQEPFVYGSLGGSNISLVPAPPVPQETSANDIKTDYELVEKVGTARAWQVFLGTHPKGFYADLARAQIERLSQQPNITLASLPPAQSSSSREASSKEALEWDALKESTDPAALQKFIKRYPDSPLSIKAQQRMDVLNKAAQEREEKARAEREAAAKAIEDARIQAEQKKAEIAAAKKREEDERAAKAAAAEQQAKAAAAELAAAKKRQDDERRAKAVEAEQQAKAAEAERKAAEAKQKAEEAERSKAAAEAAALRAASEQQARQAEAERKKAELASAQEATCKNEQGKLEELIAKGSDASGVDDLKSFARTVTCDRLGALVVATLGKFKAEAATREQQARQAEAERKKAELASAQEATCKNEQGKLEELTAKGSDGSGVDDLKSFARTVTCDRLGALVVATLGKFNAEAAKRAASLPNSPELVRSAQTQLARLGCLSGKVDGSLTTTKNALGRYLSMQGKASSGVDVTEGLVADLTKQTARACPLECKTGETLKGETCVATEKPAAPATASRKNDDDEDDAKVRRKQSSRQPERDEPRRSKPAPAPEAPRARQQAAARPSIISGGAGGGGSHTMIGVGF